MTQEQLSNWFSYHSPTTEQVGVYQKLREAALAFADVLNASVPECADKTAAIRKIREAVMTANAAIACGGK